MRRTALLVLALASAAVPAQAMVGAPPAPAASTQAGIVKAEYYCSPGFDPRYGRCVATASTDQVDLYLNEPGGYDREELAPPVVRHARHRRHGLHERY